MPGAPHALHIQHVSGHRVHGLTVQEMVLPGAADPLGLTGGALNPCLGNDLAGVIFIRPRVQVERPRLILGPPETLVNPTLEKVGIDPEELQTLLIPLALFVYLYSGLLDGGAERPGLSFGR